MRRGYKIGAGVAAAVILTTVVGVLVFIDPLVKSAIEGLGSEMAGTKVTVAEVDISPFTGKATLRGLRVGNPAGFKTESAFSVGEIRIAIDTGSLIGDVVVVEEILIDAPRITYELGSGGSNLDAIQKNIERFIGGAAHTGGKKQTAAENAGKKDPGRRKLVITTFIIRDGRIDVSATVFQGRKLSVALPSIHINNIGRRKGGVSPGEVAREVFAEVAGKVKRAVVPLDIGGALGAIKTGAAGLKGKMEKGLKGAGETIGKGVEGIGDALKGLFGK